MFTAITYARILQTYVHSRLEEIVATATCVGKLKYLRYKFATVDVTAYPTLLIPLSPHLTEEELFNGWHVQLGHLNAKYMKRLAPNTIGFICVSLLLFA
jgi:hypothetical protein